MVYSLFVVLTFQLSQLFFDQDADLQKHFEVHRQADWAYIRTVTAQGEWHGDQREYMVDYYLRSPDKLAIVSKNQKALRVINGLAAWEKGDWTNGEIIPLEVNEMLAMSEIWYYGSPLWKLREELEKKEGVKVDDYQCLWYSYETDELHYDFFVRKKDNLLYSTNISDKEGNQLVGRKVLQYRTFGPFSLPSQIRIATSTTTDLYVFTDYLIGDVVKSEWFEMPDTQKNPDQK
jgi:hypothetical protein